MNSYKYFIPLAIFSSLLNIARQVLKQNKQFTSVQGEALNSLVYCLCSPAFWRLYRGLPVSNRKTSDRKRAVQYRRENPVRS